jgi:hypothetical protein
MIEYSKLDGRKQLTPEAEIRKAAWRERSHSASHGPRATLPWPRQVALGRSGVVPPVRRRSTKGGSEQRESEVFSSSVSFAFFASRTSLTRSASLSRFAAASRATNHKSRVASHDQRLSTRNNLSNRNLRNLLKTNDRCHAYPKQNQGGIRPYFRPIEPLDDHV